MNKFFGILTLVASFCAVSLAQDVEAVPEVPAAVDTASVAVVDTAAVAVDSASVVDSTAIPTADTAIAVDSAADTAEVAADTAEVAAPAEEPAAPVEAATSVEEHAAPAEVAASAEVATTTEEPSAPAEEATAATEETTTPVESPASAEQVSEKPAAVAVKDSTKTPEKPKLILSDEPTFAIEIQPISLTFYPMFRHGLTFYATVEVVVNSNASVITRPYYASKTISKNLQSGEIAIYGLSEGFRYYFARKHVGWFASANVSFEYIQVEHKYNDSDYDDIKDTGNNIGIGLYLGRKYQIGKHFVTSLDAGVVYNQAFIDKDAKKDVNDVTNDGVGFDINYTIGVAF
ncbi:MAG: DUF3575 domain-containing protein [Fibrobacter sp.]|nr:DUF3575 domain-containing protein [Fibrobacter sp.]